MKKIQFNNRYIFESDTDQPQTSNITPQSQSSGHSKLATIITGASVGVGGVAACMAYLYKTYGITNWEQLSKWFKDAIAQNKTDGWFATFIKRIIGSIGTAISWANNLVRPLTDKFSYLNTPIAGSQFTYGSVASMAIIAAAVGAVIWKVYKVIKNRKKRKETTEAFFVRQRSEMMKALNECDSMFNDLTILTIHNTSDQFNNATTFYKNIDNNLISESNAEAEATGIKAIFKALTSGDSLISKAWDGICNLYKQVADIAKNMPMLAKVVIVITALVACWFGIKKYLANRKKKAQSASTQNNTSTRNTNDTAQNNNNTDVSNRINKSKATPTTG